MKANSRKAAALFLAACLAGCAAPVQSAPAVTPVPVDTTPAPVDATPTPAPTEQPAPAAPAGTAWVVEPTLAFDTLQPMIVDRPPSLDDASPYDYNCVRGTVTSDGFSLVCKGEGEDAKRGLIDMDGKLVVEPAWEHIDCGSGGRYVLWVWTEDRYATLDEDLRLVEIDDAERIKIMGTSTNHGLCWVEEDGRLYSFGGGDSYIWKGEWPVPHNDGPVAARWMESFPNDGSGDSGPASNEYCILTDGTRPVSEEKYEDAGAYSCGVIPVCQNGKWGYADEQGTLVFPCQYDAAWKSPHEWGDDSGYPATEDTVVLCRDGQYALYALDGRALIPFGACEELCPVSGGRLWAKQGGLWGVLELQEQS